MTIRNRQKGWTVPAILASLTVLAFLANFASQIFRSWDERVETSADSHYIMRYNIALRKYMAALGTATPPGVYNNAAFLMPATCPGGTAPDNFMDDCTFPNSTPLGYLFNTTITNVAGVVTANTNYGNATSKTGPRPDISGRIARLVNGGDLNSQTPVNQTFFNLVSDMDTGIITGTITNTARTEEWLRRDGTVLPTADFDWNNFAIANISNLFVNNNITAGGAINAPTGNITTLNSTTVNATVGNITTVNSTTGNITNIISNFVNAGRVDADDLRVTTNATVGGGCPSTDSVGKTSAGLSLDCIGGQWTDTSGSTVITGTLSSGNLIPLPSGFSLSQCDLSVSSGTNNHRLEPNHYAGSHAEITGSRTMRCGYWDDHNYYNAGRCSYVVSCKA